MGARQFVNIGRGRDASDAFFREVSRAILEYGDDVYTGTIAEKYEFTMFESSHELRTIDLVRGALDYRASSDAGASPEVVRLAELLTDKSGPVGAIALTPDEYAGHATLKGDRLFLFVGLASF
jgi:hypothetical protein